MIEKKTPTFSAVSSIVFDAVETVTNSFGRSDETSAWLFSGATSGCQAFWGDFHSRITQRT